MSSPCNKAELIVKHSTEVLNMLQSIQGLLLLSERYQSHPEIESYLGLISISLLRLEGTVKKATEDINKAA